MYLFYFFLTSGYTYCLFISEKIMNALRTIVVVIIVVLILEYLFNTAKNIDSIEDSGYHIDEE